MSPSFHFPSPFHPAELPPYGPADWRRLQPVLLRRSLAWSSAAALTAGLLLGLFLPRGASVPKPLESIVVFTHTSDAQPAPKPIGDGPTANPTPAKDGAVVAVDSTVVNIDEPVPVSFQTSFGTDTGRGIPDVPGGRQGVGDASPARPDPNRVVVLDEPPFAVFDPKPEYPSLAQQAGVEGLVRLHVLVDPEGKVVEVLMVTSVPIFDDAAEKTIRTWRFRPAILQGRPVAAWVVVPVRFVLH